MDLPSISNTESVASELNLELSALQFRSQVPLRQSLCEEASLRELISLHSSGLFQRHSYVISAQESPALGAISLAP